MERVSGEVRRRIGGSPLYGNQWKSREAFFDVSITFKAIDGLCALEPTLTFRVWSAVDENSGELVHGVECCEPLGQTRYLKVENFMKGFWTALK